MMKLGMNFTPQKMPAFKGNDTQADRERDNANRAAGERSGNTFRNVTDSEAQEHAQRSTERAQANARRFN